MPLLLALFFKIILNCGAKFTFHDGIYMKKNVNDIKRLLSDSDTLERKLSVLREHYDGCDVVILTAGPSINQIGIDKLKGFLVGKLVIAVKQTYYLAPELVDIHLLNPFNYQTYDYGAFTPIVINVSLSNSKFSLPDGMVDLEFQIDAEKTKREDSLASTRRYDDYLLDESAVRPFGPGIMYELGIYIPVLVNASTVTIFGWDIGSKTENSIDRFYESRSLSKLIQGLMMKLSIKWYNKYYVRIHNIVNVILHKYLGLNVVLNNPGITDNEATFIADSTNDLYKWFESKNIYPKIVSETSMVHPVFTRVRID